VPELLEPVHHARAHSADVHADFVGLPLRHLAQHARDHLHRVLAAPPRGERVEPAESPAHFTLLIGGRFASSSVSAFTLFSSSFIRCRSISKSCSFSQISTARPHALAADPETTPAADQLQISSLAALGALHVGELGQARLHLFERERAESGVDDLLALRTLPRVGQAAEPARFLSVHAALLSCVPRCAPEPRTTV